MSRLEEAKERYENIPIPKELNLRIQSEISKSAKIREAEMKKSNIIKFRNAIGNICAAAVAVCVIFTGGLNTSEVFAKQASKLPVIGNLAKVLTFRSYETETDDIAISVEIPSIEMIANDTGIKVDTINQEILDRCNEYVENAMVAARDYRTAFLETGGTKEEWASHNIKITVDYEVKQLGDKYLSFIVRGYQNWSNAYDEVKYYNLDLSNGKMVSLKDMLGDDYISIVNDSINAQIAKRQNDGETFFMPGEGGFTGITEDANFYINEKEVPVIVFAKYEIAPGSSGEIEFEIEVSDSYLPSEGKESETGKTDSIQSSEGVFEDNFAVDNNTAKAFAQKIQEVTAQKDLEGLADLMAFPVYIGLPDVNVVESRADFLKLGEEKIFTDD